jgi:hypothetical protein
MNSVYPFVHKPEILGHCIRKDRILIKLALNGAENKSCPWILISYVRNSGMGSLEVLKRREEVHEIVGGQFFSFFLPTSVFMKVVLRGLLEVVGVLYRQTYQGGTRGSRLCGEDRDRETENSKVCARTGDTRFIQVRVAKVANSTSCLGYQVWRPALGVGWDQVPG